MTRTIDPNRFYTIYEVAAILNISRDAVDRLIKNGSLPAVKYPKMGGRGRNVKKMVLGADLIWFIEKRKAA